MTTAHPHAHGKQRRRPPITNPPLASASAMTGASTTKPTTTSARSPRPQHAPSAAAQPERSNPSWPRPSPASPSTIPPRRPPPAWPRPPSEDCRLVTLASPWRQSSNPSVTRTTRRLAAVNRAKRCPARLTGGSRMDALGLGQVCLRAGCGKRLEGNGLSKARRIPIDVPEGAELVWSGRGSPARSALGRGLAWRRRRWCGRALGLWLDVRAAHVT